MGGGGGEGYREAEAVMRSKGIGEIRKVEAQTNHQIDLKKEELRQLVGTRYRDLIDSADSIVSMKSSCSSINNNIHRIHHSLLLINHHNTTNNNTTKREKEKDDDDDYNRPSMYSVACRVKYLVDTPESIWACLDESMFLESASRYVRATHVHRLLPDQRLFPLLRHQSLLVDSFRSQISLRSRDRLPDPSLPVSSYADALAAVSLVDRLSPSQALSLLLSSRLSWISRLRPSDPDPSSVVSFFCQALSVVQVTVGHVAELFLHALTDLPLFYRVILASPPASQLFGGIPSPDDEVRLWIDFRDSLASSMTLLSRDDVSAACLSWLRSCASEINGQHCLVDSIPSGRDLAAAESLIRDTIDSKEVLRGSLDWLRTVFGSEVELPWSRLRELVLKGDSDLWDEIFEDAFVHRMKAVISSGFDDLARRIDVAATVLAIGGDASSDHADFQVYLSRPLTGGGIWFIEPNPKKSGSLSALKTAATPAGSDFQSCLAAYFGPEVSGIKDSVESHCQSVLDDLLLFLESPKAAPRLNDLSPFLQDKCYHSISAILAQVRRELDHLYATMDSSAAAAVGGQSVPAAIAIERSLFVGRLLFAFQNHLKHIALILGSPRLWTKDNPFSSFDRTPSARRQLNVATDSSDSGTPSRKMPTGSKRHTSLASAALLSANESPSPKLEEVGGITRDLCIRAYGLWISWLANELSSILKWDLGMDDALSATTPLRGWEETVVKQEQYGDGESEMRIYLPSMPSLYIISFLFRACEEIHRVGGHVIDKTILQKLASKLLEKVVEIYEDFVSTREAQVSEKGVLQILLDLRFAADVLSGDSSTTAKESSRNSVAKSSVRRMQELNQPVFGARMDRLISRFSGRLDPIDWLTYEPYLWENVKQSYLRHAVLFGFFVQLKRKYRNTAQIPTTNPESNIMRCSVVPRFKYLPISAPALSLNRTTKTSLPTVDDISSRPSWKGYSNMEVLQNSEVDDRSGFGVAAPILKSFMQVGSKFGESTMKLGSILTDGQVGIFKDRSAAAMSTFGDILPANAAGLLSSFTANRPDS